MPLQANRSLRQALLHKQGRRKNSEAGTREFLGISPSKKTPESLQKNLQKAEMFGKILFFGTALLFVGAVSLWIFLSFWIFAKLSF